MKTLTSLILIAGIGGAVAAEPFWIRTQDRAGNLELAGTFSNGIVSLQRASAVTERFVCWSNFYTTAGRAQARVDVGGPARFHRAVAFDLSGGRAGFTNFIAAYGELTTVAGSGGATRGNKWLPSYENGPATSAQLSRPHMAMGDDAGNVYISDKEAHGIRLVRPDGTIRTVAGTGVAGNGPDSATPGTQVALSNPNGLWARGDGTVYILDVDNAKVRKLAPDGTMTTLFVVPGGIPVGRGLWMNDEETLAYVSALTTVKKWTPGGGVVDYATGFTELGNLVVDPWGQLVVTDRGAHRVYRVSPDGTTATVIAGNGWTSGGGDGQSALATGLYRVRGVWFLPTGAYLLATDDGSQLWYVDTAGMIHLLLNGSTADSTHYGDGTWFYNPGQARVSKLRCVTLDKRGDILITENDTGYVRRVRFLPYGL